MPEGQTAQEQALTNKLDREANAHALDVIDDIVSSQGSDNFAPRPEPSGEDNVTPRKPQPFVNSKRNEIISRFKTARTQRPAEQPDDIDAMTRSGVPPDFEQFRQADDDEPANAAADRSTAIANGQDDDLSPEPKQKVRLRVNHKDIDLDLDEVIAEAQKSLAAGNILDTAKSKLREVDDLIAQTRDRVARPDPAGHHTGQDRSQRADDGSSEPADNSQSHTSDDDLTQLVETIAFGDSKDAVPMLRDTIDQRVDKAVDRKVTVRLQQGRMDDEAARTNAVLKEFNDKHPELSKNRAAHAVMKEYVLTAQVEDLAAIGVTPQSLAQSLGRNLTPDDVANAHQFYRAEGYKLTRPEQMLEAAHENMLEFTGRKGGKREPSPPAGDNNGRVPPRIAVTVDRDQRRQNISPAPNRTSPPQQQQRQVQPQRQDSMKSAFMRMKNQRDAVRGRVVAGA